MTQMSHCQLRYTIFVMNVYPNICIGNLELISPVVASRIYVSYDSNVRLSNQIYSTIFVMLVTIFSGLNLCKVPHVFKKLDLLYTE